MAGADDAPSQGPRPWHARGDTRPANKLFGFLTRFGADAMPLHCAFDRRTVQGRCGAGRDGVPGTSRRDGRTRGGALARSASKASGERLGGASRACGDCVCGDRGRRDRRAWRRAGGDRTESVRVSADLKAIAIATLRDVAGNAKNPAAARAAAARTLLEMLGEVGRLQEKSGLKSEKSLVEMTSSELDGELERLASLVTPRARAPRAQRARARAPYRLL
jgi:hypothetical protein